MLLYVVSYLLMLFCFKGTDRTFLDKLHMAHADNDLYSESRRDRLEFTVTHYAGKVTYNTRRLVEKNKDTLRGDVVDLLCSSKNPVK